MRKIFPVVVALMLVCACTSSSRRFLGLQNQGVLPLSSSDAFLGPNIFLAREMEQDPYLYNFVKDRGGPTAIEIDTKGSGGPRMFMYYGNENALYIAHPHAERDIYRWIVRGPYQINWKEARGLRQLALNSQGDPVFYMQGRYQRFADARRVPEPPRVKPVFIPTPTPKRKPVRKQHAPVIVKRGEVEAAAPPPPPPPSLDPKEFYKLNTDQRAILIAQGYAPRAENGDVVHTVKYENETLPQVARWYTGSEQHKDAIATANGLDATAPLSKGAQLRIPLSLVRQEKAMPKDFR